MIKKIISGGQTGADRAALDAAIELGIPHGGWIPKGRLTENGPLPENYQLKELPTGSYPKRTEQNVIDSDGTLIIARGSLTGGSAFTAKMTEKHNKPYIYNDLNETSELEAPSIIASWVMENHIKVLNVAGPRASKNLDIYDSVKNIIKNVLRFEVADSWPKRLPQTVDEAVDQIIAEMPLDEKVRIARLSGEELAPLKLALRVYVQSKLEESGINEELRESCVAVVGEELDEAGASTVIIDALWERLTKSHGLRVVE